MEYSIVKEDLQKILDYLVGKPFGEVSHLVQIVTKCKPTTSPTPVATPTAPSLAAVPPQGATNG
jgi:hypothetical protein